MLSPEGSSLALSNYYSRLSESIRQIDQQDIVKVVSELLGARRRGSTIFLAGNGGSATTVNHYVIDWLLGTEADNPPFRVVSLAESVAALSATGNDKGFDGVFARSLRRLAREGDLLILVSASGNSPNLVEAVSAARERGVTVIAVTGFDGGRLKAMAHLNIHTPTNVGDYGVAEDLHLSVGHAIKELLIQAVRDE